MMFDRRSIDCFYICICERTVLLSNSDSLPYKSYTPRKFTDIVDVHSRYISDCYFESPTFEITGMM